MSDAIPESIRAGAPVPAYEAPKSKFGLVQWLVVIVAAIGFLFDTYELLMTPLVLAPALSELLHVPPNHPDVRDWVGRVLWITALCGGVFGLLGGYLTDRLGRRRVLTWSILIYAGSAFASGFAPAARRS